MPSFANAFKVVKQHFNKLTLAEAITASLFALRILDGSWFENPLSTGLQLLICTTAALTTDLFTDADKVSRTHAAKTVTRHALAAGAGTIGGAVSMGVLFPLTKTVAPLGAQATNQWVSHWLSPATQTSWELQSYDYYHNIAYVVQALAALESAYTHNKLENRKGTGRKASMKLAALALCRWGLALGLNICLNWILKQLPSNRPILFNPNRTNTTTDSVHELAQGHWPAINSAGLGNSNGVQSCTTSPSQNWPSGHSSTAMLAAWLATDSRLKLLLTIPGALTVVARVLADCHTPSAVLAGTLLAGLTVKGATLTLARFDMQNSSPLAKNLLPT